MPRRRLIFDVPPGHELHYSKIPPNTGYLGSRWAPLFHAYGYYIPTANVTVDRQAGVNHLLIENSKSGLLIAAVLNLFLWLGLDANSALISVTGGLLWAELESAFAYWDGHVTFGSSQVSAFATGYGLTSIFMKKRFSWWNLPFIALAAPTLYVFLRDWAKDGFAVVSKETYCCTPHRIDHLAHIGGMVAGLTTAWLTKNKRLI